MSGYIFFIREKPVRDAAAMETYRETAKGCMDGFTAKPIVTYALCDAVEGEAPDGVVVLEFPSVEEAKAWYNSPKYQAAAPHRLRAAEYRAFIVQGFEGPWPPE